MFSFPNCSNIVASESEVVVDCTEPVKINMPTVCMRDLPVAVAVPDTDIWVQKLNL